MNIQERRARIGIIGCGCRGSDHVRVFNEQALCEVRAIADLDQSRLERLSRSFPQIRITTDYRKLLADDALDAVVIAAPATARAQIGMEALQARKHVLVKAPPWISSREAHELSTLADTAGLVLMIGQELLFDDTTAKIHELLTNGELGRIRYLDSVRTGLDPMRTGLSALYDLGTDDVSVCNHLLNAVPVEVSALGSCHTRIDLEDVCFVTLKYPDGTLAHIHVSRLNPRESHTLTIVGERRTVHWDSTDSVNKLCLYDNATGDPSSGGAPDQLVQVNSQNVVHLPDTRQTDPLARQAEAFAKSVLAGTGRSCGAREALDVTKVLEAATRSMKTGGGMCPVETMPPTLCKSAWASVATVGTPRRRQPTAAESDVKDVASSPDRNAETAHSVRGG